MPIRILHIVSYMQRGGLETLIMNCYRRIDRNQMQFDFIVHRDFRSDYDDEIESLGGKIYRLPRLNPFSPGYKKALLTFFRTHPEYRIVHCHLDCMSALPLAAAKQCGVPVRIAHGHNSNQDKDWKYPLKRIYMRKIPDTATHFFACSESAGQWMFPGQKITVINNGIEAAQFSFNPQIRKEVREELSLGDGLILGHIGRFMPQKNHEYLIDIFAEVHKRIPDAKLLLMGTGPLEGQVWDKVHRLHLNDNVVFLGVRTDVNRILQAIDVFVLPSLYEGLGVATVEAQAAGCPCVLSSDVPDACDMTGIVTFIPLRESPSVWAEQIIRVSGLPRKSRKADIIAAGFDIQFTADWLVQFYLGQGA